MPRDKMKDKTKYAVDFLSTKHTHNSDATGFNIQILLSLKPCNIPLAFIFSPVTPFSLSLFPSLSPSPLSPSPPLLAFQTATMLIKLARSVNVRGEWD